MNNKVVVDTFHAFMDNDFSVCRVNFRGVGKSDGEFDNGQGELADAAAALDCLAYSSTPPRPMRVGDVPHSVRFAYGLAWPFPVNPSNRVARLTT